MAKIIAVANQKGGVGKTTSCVNLCAALNTLGKRVLLVDCDPQGNASSGMGVSKASRPNTYDILIRAIPPEACIVHTRYGDVIPTGKELAAASVELIQTAVDGSLKALVASGAVDALGSGEVLEHSGSLGGRGGVVDGGAGGRVS